MAYSDLSNKKKKQYSSYSEWSNEKNGIREGDIAPVNKQTEQKKQKWYEGWLDTGAFDDGYQFGDLTKTIVSSGADLKSNVAGGALEIGEGLVDSLAYLGGVGAKIAGQNKIAEGVKDFVKEDLYDGKKIASYLVAPEQYALKAMGEDIEDNSIWGDKTDSLAQSAGQLAGTAALASVGVPFGFQGGVPWWVTTGVTSFGGGTEQAFNEGANYAQAGLSAAISAGAEILSEKLFRGSGLGEKGLINVDKLTQGISNKVIKSLADFGIERVTEGGEEIVSELMSNLGTALYKEDNLKDILFNEEAVDEYIQSFIGGALLSGIMNVGNIKTSIQQKTDYRNGLTANEQKVFDKAYNDAITEAEKSGKKLTGKEKSKIRDNVMESLQKGYISTDTIEGVLDGETFGEYKSLTEQEKALTDEISQLENLPESQITVKQRERLLKAREELENLADKTELKTRLTDGVRNQINAESANLTERGSFLDESYKEIERRKQSFEVDLTQYNGKQREAVERAVKSGVLNNTNRSHELVNVLSKIEADKGIVFNYADNAKLKETGFALDGKTVNGFTKDGAVTLNVQSPKAWQSVVGHEVTHILEGTEAYSELQKSLFAYAESKGELESRKSALTELYNGVDADIDAELTSDLVGDYLFSDNDFIKHLTSNRNVFEKVYDEIKYLFKVATGKEKADIEKVKRQFDKVWEEFTAEDIGKTDKVNYSVSADSNGNSLSKGQQEYFKDSKVVDENGNLKVMYHGSPNADFTVFKSGSYFTEHKWYADRYQSQGASSLGYKKTANNPDTYAVYLDIKKPFDTRNKAERDIFYNEYYQQWGTGTDLMESGLPDWLDGQDLQEFLEEKGYDYDGLILDEGGTGGYGEEVTSRGLSYVVFNPEQVKSVDNQNPTDNPDIRYSISEIVDQNKTSYGVGVHLDSTLLDNLSPKERVEMVKEYVKELGGEIFTAYDNNGNATDITIAKSNRKFKNKNGKSVPVNKNLTTKYIGNETKQEAIALIDELIVTSKYADSKAPLYPHGWLDNNGKNDWEYWTTYIQDKNKTIWEATLNVATTADGEKILYDISPIKKAGRSVKSDTVPTDSSISPIQENVKKSISKQGEQPSSVGTPLKDLYYGDDIAPVKETQSTTDTQSTDNIAPITEDEANQLDKQRIDSLAEAEAPPEADTEYYNTPDTTSLDDKALENIGKQLREKLSLTPQETKAIQEIVQEYSTSENPNKEELFNKIKEQFGEKVWKERIESIADVKRYLRTTKINVSDEVKKDITDYPQFRKKNANKIHFSKDGLSIDTYYDELVSRFPDYFNYGVDRVYGDLTIPANQLRKIESVANLEIYETKTQDLDDATIQSAVDIISNGITDYKNDLTMRAAEDTAKEALDSIAPAKAEQLTNGTRGEALLNQSLDNHPITTVEDRIAEKQRAIEAEIADNKQLRREAEAGYNAEIERLSQEYLSKEDKNTKVANNIIRRIAKLEKLKASVDADYAKRISDLEARAEKVKSPEYSTAMHKQSKMQENAQWVENLLGDTSTWKDKKIGLQYSTNTERRNLRDIVRDENGNKDIAKADSIDDALNGQYNREEAAKKREIAEAREKYADLKITKAEDAYIQMLGELRYNPHTKLTEQIVKEYYEMYKNNIDTAKVDKVIEMARKDYEDWFIRVNKELKNQGMKEIPYRQGYFPHLREPKQNFIQKLLNWKTQDNEIPTSIAGLTETFKPSKSWQFFDKKRRGDRTDYSFMKGFDAYSEGVLDWIYHLDTLQKRRAVENYIRLTHSEEGVQKRIEEVYADEGIDANEAQARIAQILREFDNPLNNFVQDFTTHTNILAGKKNSYDRGVEQTFNRHIYSIMTNVQNRVSANMVLANVRSALTNFIPITQSWAQVSPVRSLQAVKDTISNAIVDDGIIDKSTFLTNRLKEPEKLYKTNWDKILDKAGIMFEVVDNFSSQVIWRSKYNQNLADGMTETEAIKNADQFSENVMAGRSKGNEPTLFNAKNPITKAFTMFQLEVNNQYGYFFKDLPNDLKTESEHWKLNLAKGYTTAFIGAYAYNALFSALTGSDAALDPIGIIEDLLRDLGLFDDDEKEEPLVALGNFGKNVAEELPLVGGLMGGGRIPISSALPYGGKYSGGLSGAIEDISEGNWGNFANEMSNPLLNVVLPVGGGQIKKAMQGLSMFNTDEEHPIAGSYTSNGNLRFPVDDTLANRVQAGIFGQWANENARDYIENGRKPLTPEQTQEYVDVDLPIADYWKYREGLKGLKTNAEKADYINSLDIKDWQKSLLMNNILDRKEDVDMSNYNNYTSYEEFDYAEKNPEKYEFFKANGISYEDYANADEDGKTAYTWAYNNPEKYKVSKVITDDVVQYRSYTSDLYDIKSDKDENGNAISGTGKSKKIDYINSLDLDYEQKIVLYRMQFKTDDTYNAEIVNYVNSLDYLTYEERVDIFTELGYTVKDGSVYWD